MEEKDKPKFQSAGMFRPGENVWRVEKADRFALIVDASDYFTAVREAMLKAEHSIVLIGWEFDTRTNFKQGQFVKKPIVKSWFKRHFGRGEESQHPHDAPANLGEFVLWLAHRRPNLEIRVLRWNIGALLSLLRPSTILTIFRWHLHKRISLKLDSQHPLTSSHHQKVIVIDNHVAFCGGIDVTLRRWDTRAHLDDDPHRVDIDGKPYPPWHDAACLMEGDAARALGDLAALRWKRATGDDLQIKPFTSPCWPDSVTPQFENVRLGVSRSSPSFHQYEPVYEIERLWLDMIAQAKRHIYIENQYFASPRIARALALRLMEEDPPEIILIGPLVSNGWLQPIAMDNARARLFGAIKSVDHRNRFAIFHPKTAQGADIYVHAKVLVVDDLYLRVGSSNINNRSMRLDTECDIVFGTQEGGTPQMQAKITDFRNDLLAEHLGCLAADVTAKLVQTGSLLATIDALNPSPEHGKRHLAPYVLSHLTRFGNWITDTEILDPDGPDEVFELMDRPRMFASWQGPDWQALKNAVSFKLK